MSETASAWLFQSVPKRYDLAKEMVAGRTETWLVTRYGDEFRKGDIVFFWMGGQISMRGLYGWGRLTQDSTRYIPNFGSGIEIRYEVKFTQHIASTDIKALPSFADHPLFSMAIGTNFRISPRQRNDLCDIISQRFGIESAP